MALLREPGCVCRHTPRRRAMRIEIFHCTGCNETITSVEILMHEGQCPECGNPVGGRRQPERNHQGARRAA